MVGSLGFSALLIGVLSADKGYGGGRGLDESSFFFTEENGVVDFV
jgi:hypothetical protein